MKFRFWGCKILSMLALYVSFFIVGAQPLHQAELRTCLSQEPINLGTLKQQIREYRSSGAWDAAVECVAELAINELRKYARVKNRKRLAVIFDIDDTLLSNWNIMLSSDFGYNYERFKQWEQLGRNKAIAPMKRVFYTALELSMSVFGITGRRENQREATERNLATEGLIGWTAIYFKPINYDKPTIIDYKAACRADIKRQGYDLIVSLGDQKSDFLGDPEAKINFKLPNPMYVIP